MSHATHVHDNGEETKKSIMWLEKSTKHLKYQNRFFPGRRTARTRQACLSLGHSWLYLMFPSSSRDELFRHTCFGFFLPQIQTPFSNKTESNPGRFCCVCVCVLFLLFCQLLKHNKSLNIYFLSCLYKECQIKIIRLHCPDYIHFLQVHEW